MFFNNLGNPLNENVIASYKFENNGIDSKNGYNGTVGGAVTFSAGIDGNRANFTNVINSNIIVPYNPVFGFKNGTDDLPFSVSFFMKQTSQIGSFNTVVSKGIISSSPNRAWHIYMSNGRLIFYMQDEAGTAIAVAILTSLITQDITHFTCTYDGSKTRNGMKIYGDGNLLITEPLVSASFNGIANRVLNIGIGASSNGNDRLNGWVDELYIFNKELNQSEVDFLQTNYYPF